MTQQNANLPTRWAIYQQQEFMTPGVEEVLSILATRCAVRSDQTVLEVAYGKGEAACRLAQQFGCRVVGIDTHTAPDYARDKAGARLLSDLAVFLRGDGGQLPFGVESFDGVLCTGGPSMGGIARCMREIFRVLKPGGWAVVSDWVWRKRPVPREALSRSDRDASEFILLDEYARTIREAGFEVLLAEMLPPHVWHGYYGPMLEVIDRWRRSSDPELQARAERSWSNEPVIYFEGLGREYWGYGVFIGRRI